MAPSCCAPGRRQEALPWLRKGVVIDPELGDAWVDLGVGLRRAGDLDGAEAAYRRALEVNPQGASAYQNLAVLLRLRGHPQEADDLMALATRASAQSPFSYLALGDVSMAHGRIEEARRFYRRAMWLNRDDAEPYAALGLAALAGGDRAEAKKWLRKAAARDKANERVRRLEARLADPIPVGEVREARPREREAWKIWIDTGGTFTDCLAVDPRGALHRAKVLSTSAVRGRIAGSARRTRSVSPRPGTSRRDSFAASPSACWASDVARTVEDSDPTDPPSERPLPPLPPDDLAGAAFELRSPEEAPVLAARLVTRTPLAAELPEIAMRLATTRGHQRAARTQGGRDRPLHHPRLRRPPRASAPSSGRTSSRWRSSAPSPSTARSSRSPSGWRRTARC